jgi:hypothetical protein
VQTAFVRSWTGLLFSCVGRVAGFLSVTMSVSLVSTVVRAALRRLDKSEPADIGDCPYVKGSRGPSRLRRPKRGPRPGGSLLWGLPIFFLPSVPVTLYAAVPDIVTEIVHDGRSLAVGPTVAEKPDQEPPAGISSTGPSSTLSE